ncbi:MAG: hypothetical protein H7Y01_07670 [Ferruginibacter sp.]|nr:hypothetical protein [Chitinophagaceae bacterium]
MGLSIHYSGKIKDYTLIDAMVAEVEDICKSLDWPYQVFDTKQSEVQPGDTAKKYTPLDVKGISFTPGESETIFLTFLPDTTLCSPVKLIYYDPVTNDLMIEVVHTKTQFAGPDTHIAILKLLHYLKEKYFTSFELNDEGYYWEKWDEKVLLSRFARYNFILDKVASALANVKLSPGESAGSLADRIEDIIKKKFGGEETN